MVSHFASRSGVCMCGAGGFTYELSVYTGHASENKMPLCSSVANNVLEMMKHRQWRKYRLFNNLFTSHALLVAFRSKDIKAIDAFRTSCIGRGMQHLQTDHELQRQERSTFDFASDRSMLSVGETVG